MYPKELVEFEKELIEAKLIEFGKQKNDGLRRLSIEEIKYIYRKINFISKILRKNNIVLTSFLAFISGRIIMNEFNEYNLLIRMVVGIAIVTLLIAVPLNLVYLIISKICFNRSTSFITGDCEIQFFDDYYLLVYNDKKFFKRIKIKRS